MKKIYALMAAMAVMTTVTACEKKNDKENGNSESTPVVTETTENNDITTTEPENTTEIETVTESVTEASTETETEGFTISENVSAFESELDEEVIAAAQQLYEAACEKEWFFVGGTHYAVDTSEYITNNNDSFYLVTEEGINSLDDIRADYHKVFSENYKDTLDNIFVEEGGRVYSLYGSKGKNIFYVGSEVVEITGRDEGEIRFKVIDRYNHESLEQPYTEERDFVIVKEADGKWKVSEFKLPY